MPLRKRSTLKKAVPPLRPSLKKVENGRLVPRVRTENEVQHLVLMVREKKGVVIIIKVEILSTRKKIITRKRIGGKTTKVLVLTTMPRRTAIKIIMAQTPKVVRKKAKEKTKCGGHRHRNLLRKNGLMKKVN